MGEVLRNIDTKNVAHGIAEQIEAAFSGYEAVRAPRFEKVLKTSFEGYHFWTNHWRSNLSQQVLDSFPKKANEWFSWIWNADIAGQGDRAKAEMERILSEGQQLRNGKPARLV